jgi:hypothetical protein
MKSKQQLEDMKPHEDFLKDIFADNEISDESKLEKILLRLALQDLKIAGLEWDVEAVMYESNYDGSY